MVRQKIHSFEVRMDSNVRAQPGRVGAERDQQDQKDLEASALRIVSRRREADAKQLAPVNTMASAPSASGTQQVLGLPLGVILHEPWFSVPVPNLGRRSAPPKRKP